MIWHCVFDVYVPSPEPFMVVRVDTDKGSGEGVEGIIISLHMDHDEAQRIADGLNLSQGSVSDDGTAVN